MLMFDVIDREEVNIPCLKVIKAFKVNTEVSFEYTLPKSNKSGNKS